MAAHAPTVLRRSRGLVWLTWSFLLVPLIQLALAIWLPGMGGDHRLAVASFEGLVLWWAGCCALITAYARHRQIRSQGWLILAALLFVSLAVQLIALHGVGALSLVDAGLGAGLGLLLLLSAGTLIRGISPLGAGLVQAGFDALCLISGMLVIRASIEPLFQGTVPTIEPTLVISVLAGLIVVIGIPFAATTRPHAPAMLVPLFLALGCGLSSGALTLWQTDLADLLAIPLRTLAWTLIAIGAMNAVARIEQPIAAPARPKLAGSAGSLLPWAVIAMALVAIVATASVPAELVALIVSATSRELVAALQRYVREDDLVLALLRERHRLREERETSASRLRDIARVVHDLTAPLNGVRVVQHTLQAQELPEAIKLCPPIDLLAVLINNLRDLVRGKSPSLRRIGVNTYEVATVSLDTILERAEIAEVQTSIEVKTADWWIMADRAAVERILDNLLTNALDVAPKGSAIKIVLSDHQEHPALLTISVVDEGPGICEHEIASLFEPKPLKRDGTTMGLGLSIVRELTEGMGGVYGMTRAEKGSVFWVRLPRADRLARTESQKGQEDHGDNYSGR